MATLMEKDVLLGMNARATAQIVKLSMESESKGVKEKIEPSLDEIDAKVAALSDKYYSSQPEDLDFDLESAHLKSIIDLLSMSREILRSLKTTKMNAVG